MNPAYNHSLSVVIPVYNSEASLCTLVARLEQALPSISSAFEALLVNDGSQDQSWEKIMELAAFGREERSCC